MTDCIMVKALGSLRAGDEAAEEILRKLRPGEMVRVSVKRSRNLKHHRKLFALMRIVFENQTRYASQDELLAAFKIAAGWTDLIIMPSGHEYRIPRSIAFDKMDQTEFEVFYDRALDIVIEHFLPGVRKQELVNEIMEFAA